MAGRAMYRYSLSNRFRLEGILRNRLLLHDVPNDAVMYSLIPEDLE